MADVFAAIDVSSVSTWAVAMSIGVVTLAVIFKAASLGKRGVNKM